MLGHKSLSLTLPLPLPLPLLLLITQCVVIAAELGLGERCRSDDVCADRAAQCRAGHCQCQDNYFISPDNRCGTHSLTYLLLSGLNNIIFFFD